MLSKAEQQDILEFCVMHIVDQGGPAWNGVACEYINDSEERCFIGALLSKEQAMEAEYYAAMDEESDVECVMSVADMCKRGWNGWEIGNDVTFLRHLQDTHDASAAEAAGDPDIFFQELPERLEIFCEKYGLRYPEEHI